MIQNRFQWADFQNKRISNFRDFIVQFLSSCRLAQIISRYIILREKQKRLLIMRAHQIHALENFTKRAKDTNSNGYIRHTTGSGKTLTAFELCCILKRMSDSKVFFLTDRVELDRQTFEEFNILVKMKLKK